MAADSVDAARRLEDRIAAEPRFSRAESAAGFLPQDAAERHRQLETIAPLVRSRLQALAAFSASGAMTDADGAAVREVLELLVMAADRGPPTLDTLPRGLRRRLVAPDTSLMVFAYPANNTFDGAQAAIDRRAAQAIDPDAIGLGTLLESMMATDRPWVWPVLIGIVTLVAVVLSIDLRNARDAVLALVPVLVGTGATFGILCWAGVGFNVMTSLVVPLLIGLGVDDGIHVVHRLREDRGEPADHAAAQVGRAILMTTATSCASFSVLLFTDHAGLESMAFVMLIGLPLSLVASVTTLPALATVWPVYSSSSTTAVP